MKHRAWWLVALVLATAALSIYWWQDLDSAAGIVPVQASGAAATEHAKNGPAGPSMAVAGSPAGSQSLWQERYNRAAQTFNSYRDATRYPPGSRPLQEHPDQERPFDPITEDRVLLGNAGKIAKGMHLRTSQERVFLSGEESVAFSLHAVDDDGVRLPLSPPRLRRQHCRKQVQQQPAASRSPICRRWPGARCPRERWAVQRTIDSLHPGLFDLFRHHPALRSGECERRKWRSHIRCGLHPRRTGNLAGCP